MIANLAYFPPQSVRFRIEPDDQEGWNLYIQDEHGAFQTTCFQLTEEQLIDLLDQITKALNAL